jgi:DNA-binding transcriptional LysR family regulator
MNKDVRRPPDRVPELSHVSLSRKLKLQQLILVAKVIDTGSLLRAAKELGMTQPAITKAVQELEAFFSAPLFERTNRGVVPTELGRLLGRRAKSMNTELRYLTDEINALQGGTAALGTPLKAGDLVLSGALGSPRRSITMPHRRRSKSASLRGLLPST